MPERLARHPSSRPVSAASLRRVSAALAATWIASLVAAGCAHQGPVTPANPGAPVTSFEMEPIKITAVNGPDGMHIESFDAAELFEQGSKALGEKRYDDALAAYDRLLKEFDDPRYARAALYNAGLAHQGKKDWSGAVVRFKALVDRYPDSSDSKDGLFQLAATYAEMANWPASAETLARTLERKDLTADDKLEALGRRGFAQFQLRDLDTSERTFRSAVAYYHQIEKEERLETDFFLALALYHLGEITHERFRGAPLRLPESQMNIDLDEKARLLLEAQRQYIDTMKLGNPEWAAASGFQVGALYEELYDSFIHAPVPPEMLRPDQGERREVYFGELRKKIRVLLEKSSHWHDENLKMIERYGIRNEWRDKSRLAYAKIQQLLDPSYRPDFQPTASGAGKGQGGKAAASVEGPPIPAAPTRGGGASEPGSDGVSGAPARDGEATTPGGERRAPERPRPADEPRRQIL